MIHNHYRINVAKNGLHFFATAPDSITEPHHMKEVLKELREKFPESDGYEVTVTYWKVSGEHIED